MSIFEVCDTSNDEYCFPIGYFGTLERAKKEIKNKMLNGFSISQHTECDYEKIEIFELSLGWGDVRKSVFCIEREKVLDETKDAFVWETISV